MDIEGKLWEIMTTQDSITHLNVTRQCGPTHDPTPEFLRLKKQRDDLAKEIITYVERLENANGHNAKEVFEL